LDLPSHFTFGLALGLVFFGSRPELALVIALGALLPDLDREYWFIPAKKYAEEQRHRALLHNVVVMALTYVVSPFLALGVFIHVLQDSFTTVKDRGVEWFYPFTRLAKRGRYDSNGVEQPLSQTEHVYFSQEDPPGLVKFADPDLQEPSTEPVPWRRVYGFALNSHLLDRGFLFGSIALILVWIFIPTTTLSFPNLSILISTPASTYEIWLVGLTAVGTLFLAGEVDRDTVHPVLGRLKRGKFLILLTGFAVLGAWISLYRDSIGSNFSTALSQPFQIIAMIALTPITAFLLIRRQTKNGKQPAII